MLAFWQVNTRLQLHKIAVRLYLIFIVIFIADLNHDLKS